jgi:DNA-binding transcriptional LysR family regulator
VLSGRVPPLDALVVLLAVAEHGSLGGAARAVGLTQPTVSARIQGMERQVGFALVERGARGSRLTPAGAALAEQAQAVVDAAVRLDAEIGALRADSRARLRVAASQTPAELLLPLWLAVLAAEHPDTAVSLVSVNSAQAARLVLEREADLGFVEGPRVPTGLGSRVVAHDRLVVVVAPTHPWARRSRPLSGRELAATRLVQREETSGTREALEVALAPYAPLAEPVLVLSTASAVRAAVAEGAGPGVLSTRAAATDLEAGRLRAVPVADVELSRSLRAVWPSGERPTGIARDLLAIALRATR